MLRWLQNGLVLIPHSSHSQVLNLTLLTFPAACDCPSDSGRPPARCWAHDMAERNNKKEENKGQNQNEVEKKLRDLSDLRLTSVTGESIALRSADLKG